MKTIRTVKGKIKRSIGGVRHALAPLRPSLLVEWVKLWHSYPVLSWIRGAEHFREGDYRSAVTDYQRGLDRFANHPAAECARLDYSYCLYRIGDVKSAAHELSKLVSADTQLRDVYLLLTRLQLICGHSLAAATTMQKCRRLFPRDLQCELAYCWSVMLARAPLSAIEQMKIRLRAMQNECALTDPNAILIDTALAYYEIRFGDAEYGEELLSRALATGSAPFEAILLRAELWLEQGRVLQAREQLQRAVKIMPSDPRPAMLLAQSYLLSGPDHEPRFAIQLATEACNKSGWDHPDCLATLVDAYEEAGDSDSAVILSARLRVLTSARQLTLESFENVGRQLQQLRHVKIHSA